MIKRDLRIVNKLGLHARAAAKLATTAKRFSSHIELEANNKSVDCKSVMSLMLLAASKGTKVTLSATGEDEIEALQATEQLINNCFDESE